MADLGSPEEPLKSPLDLADAKIGRVPCGIV
jgi:hypothetical protein